MRRKQWHEVHRTLQQINADELRGISEIAPAGLNGSTLLLVKRGAEPVKEYIYGETHELNQAGELAGFSVAPLPDDDKPELPDNINAINHPLIPWRARLNSKSNMEDLRTDVSAIRKNVEAVMPPDSYVSVTLRRQGFFEQSRIRSWVADEHATVEDGNKLVAANMMCARISVGSSRADLNKELTERVGQAVFPMLSNMSSHKSRPKFALFAVSIAAVLMSLLAVAASPIGLQTFLWLAAGVGLAILVPALVSALTISWAKRCAQNDKTTALCFRIPPHFYGACLALLAWLALMTLHIPWFAVLLPLAAAVGFGLRWWTGTAWDDIHQKPRRYWWLKRKRRANDSDFETKLGKQDKPQPFVTGYGTQRTTLTLAPMTVVSLYTPVTNNDVMKQQSHPVPEILSHDGLYLGQDQTGRNCHILPCELFGGIAIFGAAGRGKSVLTHGIMQWAATHRDDTDPQDWGKDTRIIDFEMKDDEGVNVMRRFRQKRFPYDAHTPEANKENRWRQGKTSYLADPNTACPDLLGMMDGLDARETASNIAMSMQFAFESGDILNDSLRVITTGMTIAVAVQRYIDRTGIDPESGESDIIKRVHQLEHNCAGAGQAVDQKSPIGWCVMALCGSDGQAGSAKALGKVCRALALETKDPDMILAAQAAEQLYGRPDDQGADKMTNQKILQRTNASLNKVDQFLGCEHVFTSRRARITWDKVLEHPGDYHFVLSDRQMPDGTVKCLPDGMTRKLGKWMMYRLWGTVKRNCQNWRAEGKHTMFVCDELSLLANTDDTILREMKDQGRSFGWLNVFATQYPDQLPSLLLTSVMGYSTFISFDNPDPEMAEKTAARLTGRTGEDGWDVAAVQNLPMYTAAVRTRAKDQLQPAFIVQVANFDCLD